MTTVHLRRDRRKEQQQQLASYMTEHDGDVVGFGDTRLGENAGIMDRLTKRATRTLLIDETLMTMKHFCKTA